MKIDFDVTTEIKTYLNLKKILIMNYESIVET